MLQRDQLDELSQLFATKLFERHPEWEAVAHHEAEQPFSFCVHWESPVKGRSIGCSTWDEEITVWFGDWHDHYGSWLNQTDSEAVEAALETIAQILSDQAIVEAAYKDGEWAGTRLLGIHTEDFVLAVDTSAGEDLKDDTLVEIRVQSWSGKLDEVKRQ